MALTLQIFIKPSLWNTSKELLYQIK